MPSLLSPLCLTPPTLKPLPPHTLHSLAAFRSPKEMVVKLTEEGGDVNLVEKNTRRISKEVCYSALPYERLLTLTKPSPNPL